MNIKSLLLGSVAILVATSTAQAADAIVVEPEPVEYVRVCDTYGSGFFYLPGTETCMRIGGYIRTTYGHGKNVQGGVEDGDHAEWTYRGRLNIDVRNETDWGTLRSQLRLQGGDANISNGDINVSVDRALISVAGFRVGYSDTFWTTTGHYGQGPAINDGLFNYDQALFVDYTYAADGFSLTGGFQDTTGGATDMEAPDYYVGFGYTGSWGWFSATYIYDQSAVDVVSGNVGGDAWKVAAELQNIGDSGWNFGGWYQADGDSGTSYVTGGYRGAANATVTGVAGNLVQAEWGIQANGKLTDNLVGYALYSGADAVSSSASYNDTKGYTVGVVWTPITGLAVQFEYASYESDYVLDADDYETDGFLVRITRSW